MCAGSPLLQLAVQYIVLEFYVYLGDRAVVILLAEQLDQVNFGT